MSNSTSSFGRNPLAVFAKALWQNCFWGAFNFRQSLEFRGFGLWQGGFGKIALAGFLPKPRVSCFGALSPYGRGGFLPKPPARLVVGAA